MNSAQLSEQVSVSGQLSVGDLEALVEAGIKILVCNRPDGESMDQTPFADICTAAEALGLDVVNIPFAGSEMTLEHASQFADVLKSGKRVHAYCRSGARSGNLFALAGQLDE
ncbi:MAG: sulfur transferase domain-containing protein [Pseudomonadales bacterium]